MLNKLKNQRLLLNLLLKKIAFLLFTDVTAYALDITILQYYSLVDTEDYAHHIDRTARIDHDGILYILFQKKELVIVDLLIDKNYQFKNNINLMIYVLKVLML